MEKEHKHLNAEDIKKAANTKDTVKLKEITEAASSCVFCKRVWMKILSQITS